MRTLLVVLLVIVIAGCRTGKLDYTNPTATSSQANSKTIERPRDVVWNSSIPKLGKQFFVINNLDKSSGLINISYSGNPESFIDCGRITSYVKSAGGERTHDFAGSSPTQSYEVVNSKGFYYVERNMSLEGRMNLIFEEIDQNSTKVTANTRYIVTRQVISRYVKGKPYPPETKTHTISFNSGEGASFPVPLFDGRVTHCVSTGKLELDILSQIE
jgi:hypothetical protein